jgi:transcriptional regulator with XRE-family HTH domain
MQTRYEVLADGRVFTVAPPMRLSVEKLRAALAARSLTQKDLARLAGLPAVSVAQLFSGYRDDPRVSTMVRVAMVLGVPVYDLLDIGQAPREGRSAKFRNGSKGGPVVAGSERAAAARSQPPA